MGLSFPVKRTSPAKVSPTITVPCTSTVLTRKLSCVYAWVFGVDVSSDLSRSTTPRTPTLPPERLPLRPPRVLPRTSSWDLPSDINPPPFPLPSSQPVCSFPSSTSVCSVSLLLHLVCSPHLPRVSRSTSSDPSVTMPEVLPRWPDVTRVFVPRPIPSMLLVTPLLRSVRVSPSDLPPSCLLPFSVPSPPRSDGSSSTVSTCFVPSPSPSSSSVPCFHTSSPR